MDKLDALKRRLKLVRYSILVTYKLYFKTILRADSRTLNI